MLERAATPSGLLLLRLRGSTSGRGAKEIFDGIDRGEPVGDSPAQSDEDEVRRIPTELVLAGAVRGRTMLWVTLIGDNVAI